MATEFSIILDSLPALMLGMVNTVVFSVIAALFGLVIGLGIAQLRNNASHGFGASCSRMLAAGFVEIFRNTPFLVQAFLIYFGLAEWGIRLNAWICGILVLSLYASANFSESIRAGLASVPPGQTEAARALGFRPFFIIFRIVLPQSVGYLVPALTNQFIGLIKDSAALSVITVPEVAMAAQQIVGTTFDPVETYAAVAFLYWFVTTLLATGLNWMERRWTPWRSRAAATPLKSRAYAAT